MILYNSKYLPITKIKSIMTMMATTLWCCVIETIIKMTITIMHAFNKYYYDKDDHYHGSL